jgi:hypothetical protein
MRNYATTNGDLQEQKLVIPINENKGIEEIPIIQDFFFLIRPFIHLFKLGMRDRPRPRQ